jgi:hypothetical protein
MKYIYTIIVSALLIVNLFSNINTTNAQTCPTCQTGEICVKSADGPLVCRLSATNCKKADGSDGCDTSKVCIKTSATATTGICVDDAPASAKAQAPTAESGNTPATSTNPTGLLDGLNLFRDAGSGLNTTGTLIGYIANIIRWILGLLGTVFFVIIVIQGYLYMTAGGDSSKTASAAGAIGNAVVGLLIIMGAFLITNFVTSGLTYNNSSTPTSTTSQCGTESCRRNQVCVNQGGSPTCTDNAASTDGKCGTETCSSRQVCVNRGTPAVPRCVTNASTS